MHKVIEISKMTFIAKPKEVSVKLKDVAEKTLPDGKPAYSADVYLPFGNGFSQWPTELFLRGGELVKAEEMYQLLSSVVPGTVVKVAIAPSKLRPPYKRKTGEMITPTDDGVDGSYYWNITGISTPLPVAQTPASKPPPADEPPLFPDDEQPPKYGQPKDYWAARQERIEGQWAINQAREQVQDTHPIRTTSGDEAEAKDTRRFQAEVVNRAREYLAMLDLVVKQGKATKES